MTPILMVPSVYCACAALHRSASAMAERLNSRFMRHSPRFGFAHVKLDDAGMIVSPRRLLHPQIFLQLIKVCIEFGIQKLVDDPSMIHHIVAVRDCRGETKVLFHQENREPLLLEQSNGLADLLNDNGGQPL